MPFTLAHPSLFLPMIYTPKSWFSVTALVIGSMAPDFEYFIRMRIQSDYSHTLSGVFWLDLPLTIIVAFIFHCVIRKHLYENLPFALQERLKPFNNFNWKNYFLKNWFIVIVSALVGIFSHLFWDSFTHYGAYFVEHLPSLQKDLLSIPVYKILQHASTIIGGFVICVVLWKLPRSKGIVRTSINPYYWISFLLIVSSIVVLRLFFGLSFTQYGHVIVTAISASFIALILAPIIAKKVAVFFKKV